MLSEDAKNAIDSLSKDELRIEVKKANRSRFQGDNFAYVQARLEQVEENEASAEHKAELDLAQEANTLAKSANQIAKESSETSKKALRASVLAVIVALVAIVVPMCASR